MSGTADTWTRWDAARDAGRLPTEMARELDDEVIARLIAEAGAGRDDERKLLAAESLRRTTDRQQAENQEALPPDKEAAAHRKVANAGAEKIHAAERTLERASSSQKAAPALQQAHEASLRAEQHRGHVETHAELRAKHRQEVRDLTETLRRRRADDRT